MQPGGYERHRIPLETLEAGRGDVFYAFPWRFTIEPPAARYCALTLYLGSWPLLWYAFPMRENLSASLYFVSISRIGRIKE